MGYNREYNQRYHREYVEKIRALVQRAKDKPCADCGKRYPWYVMDLDHVRGKKEFQIGDAGSYHRPIDVVIAEIEKCDVVCANCHRERTFTRLTLS